MVQGKITEADSSTIRPNPLHLHYRFPNSIISLPIFTPNALSAATLPIYPGLVQASNNAACIHSGLVWIVYKYNKLSTKNVFSIYQLFSSYLPILHFIKKSANNNFIYPAKKQTHKQKSKQRPQQAVLKVITHTQNAISL